MELIRDISEELKSSYIDYAMSVIVGRALPDVRDGLKPVQRRILWTMHEMGLRHDKPYRKSARIVGECFVKGTLVSTPKGLIPIEKLKVGDEVYTQNGVRRVVELYIMPKQELVEVILENGLKNVCTKGQMFKVLTPDLRFVWKKAEELKRGDRIVLRAVYPDIREYRKVAGLTLDEDLAYLLGFFLADGWIDEAGGIRFFSEERRIIERLADIIADKFKVGVKIESRNGGYVLRAKGSKVDELMGIQDKILEQILESPKSVVYAFIAGFVDSGGEIFKSRSAISICSTSEELIRMLQVVLFSLGIVSSLHESGSCHYLEIEGTFFAKLIENLMGLSCKADIHAVLPCSRYTKGFRYLNAIGVKSRYFSRAKICRRNPADTTRIYRSPAKELGICENDDIFFMEVKEVRKAEPDVTYDIQVEEEHEFIANGMIAHNCLGKYHPHGDQPVYEALVRMAQDFVMRYPLVDGQGNFGSIDGDEPAAMRYTEARLTKLAEELLADIDKDTIDFVPNFDATLKEPSVLPAKIPNLLANGSSGIAVGMATNIPPHNLKEVCRAIIAYIKNPEITVKELMEFVKGPDFPTGGIIVGKKGIEKAYETGKGKIVVRGRVEIEKNAIVIREVPYMVNKARLVEKIADLIKDGRLEEAKTVRDESDREGIRVVVELKGGADVDTALKKLYTYTPLQTTFGIINLALVDGEPRILNLKELIACYVDHRREVVRRRTAYALRIARDRLHVVEGLKKAVENLESVVNLIKMAKTPEEAKKGLMESYGLSEKQAEAILQMRLQKLTSTEISALLKEYDELKEKIAELEAILSNPSRIDEIIIEELEELIDEYGDERRTEILEEEEEIKAEELITSEENLVVITENGFVKRMDIEFKTQARGGVGVLGMPVRDGDSPAVAVLCNSLQKLLVFTNVGKAYWISVHEIPKQDRTGKGVSIRKFLGLAKGEKVVSAVAVDDFVGDQYVVILTEDGYIKKTRLSEFANAKRAGIIASSAKIAFARMFKDGDVAIATNNGYLARFKAEEVPEKGRNAKGVKAISLREGDSIAWLSIGKEKEFLILTEDGLGKRTDVEEFRLTNRGSMGVIAIRGKIAVVEFVKGKEDVVIFTKDGYAIRVAVKNIPKQERYSKGVEVSKRGVSCAILI